MVNGRAPADRNPLYFTNIQKYSRLPISTKSRLLYRKAYLYHYIVDFFTKIGNKDDFLIHQKMVLMHLEHKNHGVCIPQLNKNPYTTLRM